MNRKSTFHKGRWAVARERLRIADMRPPDSRKEAYCFGDVLPDLMKKMGLASAHWMNALNEEWPALVGEAVARHTRPGRMDRNRLVVFVDSSVWLNELSRYGRTEMLSALRKRFGAAKIGDISLQMDPNG